MKRNTIFAVHRNAILAMSVVAGVLMHAPAAHAFKIVTCDGAKLKWPGNSANAKMTRNKCSVPDGSTQAAAYFSAIDRWNQVGGMWDKLSASFAWDSGHCYITLDDDENDFALVDVGEIDGALGSTIVWRDCPEIESIDIMMANLDTQSFANPDEAFAAGTGLSSTGHLAVLHEFGHGLGLSLKAKGSSADNHATGFAVMRASAPGPLIGGLSQPHSRPMPDDAAGGRSLYPSGNNEFNLMASAQSLVSGSIVNNAPWQTVNMCRGDSLTFTWTMANGGTTDATVDQRFYIAKNPTAHNSTGVTLATWFDATVTAQGVVFPSVKLPIPCGTSTGLYWLYHEVDSNNEFGEWNESDNVVHNPLTIQVNNCGC
jgi:hypothetical protein